MVVALIGMAPQPPQRDGTPLVGIRRSIGDGLRFVRGNQALMGSFAIDLLAMTFGMPRALFAVLAARRLRRGRGRHRPALCGGVGGRDRGGADHRLARARPAARA